MCVTYNTGAHRIQNKKLKLISPYLHLNLNFHSVYLPPPLARGEISCFSARFFTPSPIPCLCLQTDNPFSLGPFYPSITFGSRFSMGRVNYTSHFSYFPLLASTLFSMGCFIFSIMVPSLLPSPATSLLISFLLKGFKQLVKRQG